MSITNLCLPSTQTVFDGFTGDKTDFDRKWNTPSRGPGPDIFKDDDGLDDKSVLRNLFGFGFPGFGKS